MADKVSSELSKIQKELDKNDQQLKDGDDIIANAASLAYHVNVTNTDRVLVQSKFIRLDSAITNWNNIISSHKDKSASGLVNIVLPKLEDVKDIQELAEIMAKQSLVTVQDYADSVYGQDTPRSRQLMICWQNLQGKDDPAIARVAECLRTLKATNKTAEAKKLFDVLQCVRPWTK